MQKFSTCIFLDGFCEESTKSNIESCTITAIWFNPIETCVALYCLFKYFMFIHCGENWFIYCFEPKMPVLASPQT